jgi:hypothetical protein
LKTRIEEGRPSDWTKRHWVALIEAERSIQLSADSVRRYPFYWRDSAHRCGPSTRNRSNSWVLRVHSEVENTSSSRTTYTSSKVKKDRSKISLRGL